MNTDQTPEQTPTPQDKKPRRSLLETITAHSAAGNSNSTGAVEYNRFSDGGPKWR